MLQDPPRRGRLDHRRHRLVRHRQVRPAELQGHPLPAHPVRPPRLARPRISGRELPVEAQVVGHHLKLKKNQHIKLLGPEPLKLEIQEAHT